jgi:hypothetical protein
MREEPRVRRPHQNDFIVGSQPLLAVQEIPYGRSYIPRIASEVSKSQDPDKSSAQPVIGCGWCLPEEARIAIMNARSDLPSISSYSGNVGGERDRKVGRVCVPRRINLQQRALVAAPPGHGNLLGRSLLYGHRRGTIGSVRLGLSPL